jgi:hypothetical protein
MHGTIQPFAKSRIVRRDDSWTYRETEVLREHWPDMAAMRKLLPHRTETAIRSMAAKCGAAPPKDQHIWTGAEDKRLRARAAEGMSCKLIARELGLRPLQVTNRLRYIGVQIARKPPALCGDELADAVRLRAFQMNISIRDLDRSLGNNRIFENAVTKKRVLPKHIEKAVKALGGRLTIVWDDL